MIDLAHFKKVSEDDKTAVLRHAKGHEIRIVKRSLDRKARTALDRLEVHPPVTKEQRLAAGGEVEDPTKDLAAPVPTASDAQTGAPVAPAPSAPAAPVTINIQAPGAAGAPEAPPAPEPSTAQKMGQALGNAVQYLQPMQTAKQVKGLMDVAASPGAQHLMEGIGAGMTGNPLPQPPSAGAPAAPAAPAPASLAPAAPGAPELPSPAEMTEKLQQGAMGMGLKGLDQQAAAEAQLAGDRSKLLGDAAKADVSLESEFKTKMADIGKRIDDVTTDIKNGHINPNHYMESRSTGDRIATAIGLVLGGIGGGLTHQENPVLKMLNLEIERDVASQKANIDNKHSLLGALQKQQGDLRSATDEFRLIRANTIAHQLDEAAAKAGSPMAAAHAKQAKAALMEHYAPLMMKASLNAAVSKIAKSGDPDAVGRMLPQLRTYAPEMAKEMEGRYVPGVGLAAVPLSEKVRDTLEARNTLQDSVHRLRDFAKIHEGAIDPATVQYGKTLAKTVQDAYRRANGQGVFKESEAQFVNGIVSEDPTAFFNKFRVDPKLKALEDSNLQELNGIRRSVGLPSARGPVEVKTVNGAQYMKVPGGWQKVK